jgi:hypothetical protein
MKLSIVDDSKEVNWTVVDVQGLNVKNGVEVVRVFSFNLRKDFQVKTATSLGRCAVCQNAGYIDRNIAAKF